PAPAVTTADKAAALGMEPTDYRQYRHDTAVDQVREAARGLFAKTGLRVMDALDQQPADDTGCSCGGRFPTFHLHADTHEPVTETPAVPAAPEGAR
ncbi:hypothetical protein AB0L80_43130, partial [Streptomyces sp. NPDC052069]|uniref:hypothetical protein n=1 Tax=Streptomyces sp. NPDC052069 TaxID=3154650 RepID=UPI00342E1B4C